MSDVKGGPLFAAIVGGGCAGLTAAIRLERMAPKGLAIFEPNNARHDHIWAYWDDGGADRNWQGTLQRDDGKSGIYW